MPWEKRVADLLTAARVPLALGVAWAALARGEKAIMLVLALLVIAATIDTLDGYFARRSGYAGQTWVGGHDLEFDIMFSVGLLFYLYAAGLMPLYIAAPYFIIWMVVFWQQDTISNAFAVLFQGPIYIWVFLAAIIEVPAVIGFLLIWLALMIGFAGKRFWGQRLPKLVQELREIFHLRSHEEN